MQRSTETASSSRVIGDLIGTDALGVGGGGTGIGRAVALALARTGTHVPSTGRGRDRAPYADGATRAEPEDLVGPVLFLLSAASAFVTGTGLAADGGWTGSIGLPPSPAAS